MSIANSWSLLRPMSTELVMPSNQIILCHPFFSCPQSFPASGSFPKSQFFASGGQSIGVPASASVLPMTIQDWFPLGWTGWIFVAVQETLKSLLQNHGSKASILWCSAFFIVQLSHPYMTTGKTIALTRRTFVNLSDWAGIIHTTFYGCDQRHIDGYFSGCNTDGHWRLTFTGPWC